MNRKQNWLLLIMMILFQGCQKDLDVAVPQQGPKLVLNSVNILGDRIRVQLSHSVSSVAQSSRDEDNISDAIVILFDNDGIADTLRYYPDEKEYASDITTMQEHVYRLKAIANGYQTVEATADVPYPVTLDLHYKADTGVNRYHQSTDLLRVTFTDKADSREDYYRVRMIKAGSTFQQYTGGCIETSDPSAENLLDETIGEIGCFSGEGIFCRDQLFNGQAKVLALFAEHKELLPVIDSVGNSSYIIVQLDHMSESYFKYLKTTAYVIHNNANPFAEPSNAFSNIQNGYGIFTVLSRSQRNIR